MKVCGKKDIHVPGCDDCSELEERVEAVEECCDDAHDEIDTLNTGKADKEYVDDSIENVNQTIVDVADTLGERIDNIITASEPSVITLWEGVMESIGDSANLSEDVNDFDYLDIYYRTSADESEGYYNTVRIPADQFANYTITVGGTLSPLGESPNLSQYLTQLSFVDDTATIDNIREWAWNGSQSSDASDDMQAETGVTIYRIDGVKEAGGNAEIADAREGVDGTIYPSLGDAIRGQIQDTRDMIQSCPVQDVQVNGTSVVDQNGVAHVASAVKLSDKLDFYLYKTNAYINDSGVDVALNGYDIYKFPVSRGDVLRIEQTTGAEKFFGGISAGYVLHIQQGNVISQMSTAGTTYAYWRGSNGTRSELKVYTPEGVSAVYVSIKRGNESFITFMINRPLPDVSAPALIHQYNTVYTVEESNSMVGHIYARNADIGSITTAGYSVRTIPVKAGDKVTVSQRATGISYWGKYVKASEIQTTDMIGNDITQTFTAPENGVMDFFFYTGDAITVTVYPADAITIDWSNIKNIPDSTNPFSGLNAVAFGTSLTYRAISSYGYLQYLPALSGMTFDNQGVGSSSILPHTSTTNMLNAIKNYTSYSDKRVCILEGFVNDWYYNATSALLGEYTDSTETTVCGCVRSALNYIMAQNSNITVFLVLDPYGRLYNSIDCRSVAQNRGGITQFEYYEKIAKVAESIGIHVIRLYSFSGISEATPQYIIDNIHPTALGAEQTAYAIWSKMKTCYPNKTV